MTNYEIRKNEMYAVADSKNANLETLKTELAYAKKIYYKIASDERKARPKNGEPETAEHLAILQEKSRAHDAYNNAKIRYVDALDVVDWASRQRLADSVAYLDTATVSAFIACKNQ